MVLAGSIETEQLSLAANEEHIVLILMIDSPVTDVSR